MKSIAWLFRFSMIGGAVGYGVQLAKIIWNKNAEGVSLLGFSILIFMQVIIMLHGWINLKEGCYKIMAANIIFCIGIVLTTIIY